MIRRSGAWVAGFRGPAARARWTTGGLRSDPRCCSAAFRDIRQWIVHGDALSGVGMMGSAEYVTEEDAEEIRQYLLSAAFRVCANENGHSG